MSKEKEFKKHTDYIRSFANNSIIRGRIDQALNRIVFISRQKGAESKLQALKEKVEEKKNYESLDEFNDGYQQACGEVLNLITNLEGNG